MTNNSTLSIQATAPAVWCALTKPDLIKQYFYGTEAISDWKEGSPIIFKGEWDGRPYEDKGTILIAETDKLLRYNYWSALSGIEDKSENYMVITYELFENDGYTSLAVTQDNIPDHSQRSHADQNWRKIMNDLKVLLENKTMEEALYPKG